MSAFGRFWTWHWNQRDEQTMLHKDCDPTAIELQFNRRETAHWPTQFVINQEVISMSNSIQQGLSILRCRQVQARTGLARSTIYLHIKNGAFPRPVPLGVRAVGWLESEVSDWIAERVRIARGEAKSAG